MNNRTEKIYVNKNTKKQYTRKEIRALKMRSKIRRIKKAFKRITFLICILFSLYLIFGIIRENNFFPVRETDAIIGNASEENLIKPKTYANDEIRVTLERLSETSVTYREIYDHMDSYPEALLAALCSNSEMLDFTLGYPDKANTEIGGFTKKELEKESPLLIQWDKRWGYASYGESCVGLAGCAPTCLSMVILALSHNAEATPAEVATYAQDSGYYMTGTGTSWSLMTEGASHFGIKGSELNLSERKIFSELKLGHPIICSMSPGDFTSQGHFIVLVGEQDGKLIVNDPNSRERSRLLWDYDVIEGQIKNLWAFSN